MSTLPSLLPLEAKPLLSLLDRSEPQVLVVVGSGISWGATEEPRSTWRGLLLHGVNHLESSGIWSPRRAEAERTLIEESFAGRFILDEVLRRADSLSEAFEAPYGEPFADWLKVAIGTLHPRVGQTAALEGLRDLADAGALVMTTNYDDLLCQATGMPAVTWEEPEEFLRVVNRDRRGILHVHGHWQRPSSIVFGKKSYDRIVAATDLQDTVKGLWQQWHWLFVGCGSGLEDPNLGHLLQWGSERFGRAARTDFFFGKSGDAPAARSDETTSRVVVSYADHSELPEFLGALTPGARSWPFERLTADSKRFRQPGESPLQSPFPSWQEYLAGSVPTFAADGEVERRLSAFGWAFVLEVASVGKTTLALRLATRPEQRDRPVFYLELRQTPSDEETFESDASAALRRLARPGTLLILDNAHHQPDLTTKLWEQWRDRPGGSCLLILATRMDKPMHVAGDNALLPLEHHLENPAIHLRPSPEDLGNIFLHVMSRFPSRKSVNLPSVPPSALSAWHRIFGSELGAFVAAVTERQAQLVRGDWDLPESAAAEWMFERHLKYLNPAELENAICLSVFGVQELELDVPQAALPHPDAIRRLLTKGLVERIELAGGKWVRFGLREPGWGRLLLASASPVLDARSILVETASKNLVLAMTLNSRLERTGRKDDQKILWEGLASRSERMVEQLFEAPLPYIASFLTAAVAQGEEDLVLAIWAALAEEQQRLAELAFETQLHSVAAFLTTARSQGQQELANALWSAFAANLDRLVGRAFEMPLDLVATFLATARFQGQQELANALWNGLAANLGRLVELAFETHLHFVATFLTTARFQGQQALANALWNALAANPDRLVELAFETQLNDVAAFLNTAQSQGQQALANALWNALAANPGRLLKRAFETPLSDLAAFLNTARDHGPEELAASLWQALADQPQRLAEKAFEAPLHLVAGFLIIARSQGQQKLVSALCNALAANPGRLVERAIKTPLGEVAAFLNTARDHGPRELANAVWNKLAADPDRLVQPALQAPINDLSFFLNTARDHDQRELVSTLWNGVAADPALLVERALQASLNDLLSFLNTTRNHGQRELANAVWDKLAADFGRLVERALQAPLNDLTSFLNTARDHGQMELAAALLQALAAQPERIATRAGAMSLESLGGFLAEVRSHGRDDFATAIGTILCKNPERLVQTALKTPGRQLSAFLFQAPTNLAIEVVARFELSDWIREELPHHHRAASLALQLGALGREDLKDALLENLLYRANPQDFAYPAALSEIVKLLTNIPAGAEDHLDHFIHNVCASSWVDESYRTSSSFALAGALTALALRQRPKVILSLWRRSLGTRIATELSSVTSIQDAELSGVVELLGASQLAGWQIPRPMISTLPLYRITNLPREVLPHRDEASNVEIYQLQLWLGMRVVAALAQGNLYVGPAIVERTLELWRTNLGESAADPGSTTHRVNRSMVDWLERCARTRGFLLRNPEPLWVLAGFPRDPRSLVLP